MLLQQSVARNLAVFMTDSTDHVTGKAGLTLTITASKDGGAFASTVPTVTDLGSGWYKLALTTTDTNTIGDLVLHITATGADPADVKVQVIAPNLFTSGYVSSNVLLWNNASVQAPTTAGVPRVEVAAMMANTVTSSAIATDAIGSAQVATSAVTEIQTGLATASAVAALPSAAANASAVWNEARAGHVTAGTFGEYTNANVTAMAANTVTASAVATDAVTEIQTGLATASAVAAIKAKTDLLPSTAAGSVGGLVTSAADSGGGVLYLDSLERAGANVFAWKNTTVPSPTVAGIPRVEVASMMADVITSASVAASAASEIAAAVWDEVIENSKTARQILRGIKAATFGKLIRTLSTRRFRDDADTKDRITATVDDSGRSSLVVDLS